MQRIVLIMILVLAVSGLDAQRQRQKEVGINMTQMVSQFIPFGSPRTSAGPFAILWRAGAKGRFFNFQMGANVSDSEDDNFMNVQIGFLRKKTLSEKWSYYTSQNLIASFGSFNVPGDRQNDGDGIIGISFVGGFQYEITEFLALNTETMFVFAVGGNDGAFSFIPPVGVFLVAKF